MDSLWTVNSPKSDAKTILGDVCTASRCIAFGLWQAQCLSIIFIITLPSHTEQGFRVHFTIFTRKPTLSFACLASLVHVRANVSHTQTTTLAFFILFFVVVVVLLCDVLVILVHRPVDAIAESNCKCRHSIHIHRVVTLSMMQACFLAIAGARQLHTSHCKLCVLKSHETAHWKYEQSHELTYDGGGGERSNMALNFIWSTIFFCFSFHLIFVLLLCADEES